MLSSHHLRHQTFKTKRLSHFLLLNPNRYLKPSKSFSSNQSLKPRIPKSLLHQIDSCETLEQLKQIHARSIASGLAYDHLILTKIAESFLNSRNLDYATRVFVRIREPGIFVRNALIRAYSSSETPSFAISIYNEMWTGDDVGPDNYTFPFVFRACANYSASEKGREVHGVIIRIGYDSDRFIRSSLLGFYAACLGIGDAKQVFDESTERDVVFWNAMIMGYARAGGALEAFQLFKEMEFGTMRPNEGTMLGLIVACAMTKDMGLGREIHGYVKKNVGSMIGVRVGASLIDLYVKCGNLNYAQKLFDEMPERNTIVWNSLICGYSRSGSPTRAIELFMEMHASNVRPDNFTISSILSACAQTGALNLGDWVRRYVEKNGISDVFVATALVDMYCKCGSIALAREIFDQMPSRNIATWNAILWGHALHGHAQCTLDLFHEMTKWGVKPDSITFLAILSACAHAGLVEDGCQYLDSMKDYYKIPPTVEHYGCMVDLLGCAGLLREAKELIEKMEIEPNIVVWGSLLSACSIHGNVEIGEQAAAHVFELDQMDGGSYVLLSNMYAVARRFDGVKAVREMMAERGVRKPPGCSMIEVGNVVHEFVVADKAHPRSEEIYLVLDELSRKLKVAGYVPMLAIDQDK
ncbi:pentatricopeptide repeat-containing protein At1g08070, chloroplastic-like [Magnolia sinica]|uniref:pentatricopeptide repeat-containing protein At1g08070, chloroplastic-like n=1 Tax=Magnolia sinica TaxID=86752 RepID=UPI002659341C|nr:pentatricopeptide repeat-containing protein At1g08070, chloroplastic-like [Magnolia sinica]